MNEESSGMDESGVRVVGIVRLRLRDTGAGDGVAAMWPWLWRSSPICRLL